MGEIAGEAAPRGRVTGEPSPARLLRNETGMGDKSVSTSVLCTHLLTVFPLDPGEVFGA